MRGIRIGVASTAIILFMETQAVSADIPSKATPLNAPAEDTCTSVVDFFTTACQLSASGVRFYGTVDVGFDYMTHGAPLDKLAGNGIQEFLGHNSSGARWSLAPNNTSLSDIGLQIKESLGGGWTFIGQLETGFNPYGLPHIGNAPGSVQENAGLPLNEQRAPSDGGINGKFYNDFGFVGVSNDTWGTLTFGRQNTLIKDGLVAYDAVSNAYAFSYLGYFGSIAGGGDTEDAKGTTAIKYRVHVANWHFGAFTQIGGYNAGNASQAVAQGNIGADYRLGYGVLSGEVIGGWTKGAVSEGLSGASILPGVPDTMSPQHLAVTLSDNTEVTLLAKYTTDRFTLYSGYEWLQFANPSDPVSSFTDITGAQLCNTCLVGGQPTTFSTTTYEVHKIQQVMWTGVKYAATSSVDAMLSYYHIIQNDFSGGASASAGGVTENCAQNSIALGSCAGTMDVVSLAVDWKFAPKWDTYLGTMYEKQSGGLVSGYQATSNWSATAGIRFRW